MTCKDYAKTIVCLCMQRLLTCKDIQTLGRKRLVCIFRSVFYFVFEKFCISVFWV